MAVLPRMPLAPLFAVAAAAAALLAPAVLTAAPMGSNATFPVFDGAAALTSGPDGNMWFLESGGDRIGRMSPSDGTVTTFTVPGNSVSLYDMTAGPDGNLWFTDQGDHAVGRITPAGGITIFPQAQINSAVLGPISAGPDGNLWFGWQDTGVGGNWVERMDPTGDTASLAMLGGGWVLSGLTPGGAAGVYYRESLGLNMGVVTTGLVPDAALPGTVQGQAAAVAPDSSLWYSATLSNSIRRWSPDSRSQTAQFALPAAGGVMAWGADGNLWVGLTNKATLRRLTPAGTSTDTGSALPAGFFNSIAAGPDGSMWYLASGGNRVARTGTGVGAPTQVTLSESGRAYRCTTNALPTAMGGVTRSWAWTVGGAPIDGFTGSGTETAWTASAADVGKAVQCAVRDTYTPSLIQMGFRSEAMVVPASSGADTPSSGASGGGAAPLRLAASWRITGRKVFATFRPTAGASGNRITAAPAKGGKSRAGRCAVAGKGRARKVTCSISLPKGAGRWRVTAQARKGSAVVAQAQRVFAVR